MANNRRVRIIFGFIFSIMLMFFPHVSVYATASITTATGGSSISADTTVGTYTALTGPVIIEGAVGDVGTGTIILSAPSGFVFDTGTNVTVTVTNGSCSGGGNAAVKLGTGSGSTSETVTPTANSITNNVKTASKGASGCASRLTYTNIKVRPSGGTPLASGNLTQSSSSTSTINGVVKGSTNFGTLTEVVGAKNKLTITTQPPSTTLLNSNFSTLPVVAVQDQFGNTVGTDSISTITRAVILSGQSCGGTAGSGVLTSTPASGVAVTNGVLTYTAMQYSAIESIALCFSSTGITSALSSAITVFTTPTVTTEAVSSIKDSSAVGNGTITATGGVSNDKQGFVYDTLSHSTPGNVAPSSSGYASSAETVGSFSTGAFTKSITGLTGGITYYARAYAHNSAGYSYGNEVSFTTAVISITLNSNGVVTYGYVAANSSKNTTASGLNNTQSIKNTSTIAEDFNIKGQDSASWTLSSISGANQYVHKFSTNGGTSWTALSTTYQTLFSNINPASSSNFDLQITTPTTTSSYTQQDVSVMIQAVAH